MTVESTTYLTENEAAKLCTELGVPISPRTLTNRRCFGTGPIFIKTLSRVRYRREDVIDWANAQLGKPRQSTKDSGGGQ